MSRIPEFLQGLLYVRTSAELRVNAEAQARAWNGETSAAFLSYFRLSGLMPGKKILVESLLANPPEDPRSLHRFLALASYENEAELKKLILTLCARIPAILSSRLYTVFMHTDDEKKRLLVLKCLSASGVSLYVKEFLGELEKLSPDLQEAVLEYVESVPELSSEEKALLEEKLALLAGELEDAGSTQEFFRRILPARLRFGLSFKKIFAKILKRKTGIARLSPDELEDLSNVWEARKVTRTREDAWETLLGEELFFQTAVFDPVFREKLAKLLPEKIAELEKKTNEELHLVLGRLGRIDLASAPVLLDWLKATAKVSLRQILMEHLLFYRFPDDAGETYRSLCIDTFRDKNHVRIFETAARNLVMRFFHNGLESVVKAFESLESAEHKIAMLQGLLHALEEHGMSKRISPADLYRIHLIAGNIVDFLRGKEIQETLFRHFCHLVSLLRIATYENEILAFAEIYPVNTYLLTALCSFDTEASCRLLLKKMEGFLENPSVDWEWGLTVFSELSSRPHKMARLFPDELLKKFLFHPYFSQAVVRFLAFYKRPELKEHIFQLARRGDLGLRIHTMEFLSQLPPREAAAEARHFFDARDDVAVRDLAVGLLAFHEDEAVIRKICGYLILEKKDAEFAAGFFKALEPHPEIWDRCGRSFLSFRKTDGFKPFRPLAEELALDLFGEEISDVLPLDEVLGEKHDG